MNAIRHRHLLLFLVALILPSLVIAGLGWKLLTSERENAEHRLKEQRDSALEEIGRDVLTRLDVTLQAAPPGAIMSSGPLVLVGWAEDGRLILPWEDQSAIQRFGFDRLPPNLEYQLDEARRAEIEKSYARAASLYEQALPHARQDTERAFARQGLARSLVKSGAKARGLDVYSRELLTLPSNVIDDTGTPFASWAATELVRWRAFDRDVLDRIEQDLDSPVALTPNTAAHWRGVAESLQRFGEGDTVRRASVVLERLSTWTQLLEQARAFQEKFPGLAVTKNDWKAYVEGGGSWLVRIAEQPATRPLVVVVRARDILQSVESTRASAGARVRIVVGGSDSDGVPLKEPQLPDLRVSSLSSPAEATAGSGLAQMFFALSLLFVVSLTSLAGYLAWRDTRRELRMADMRSQFVASVSHELKTPLTSIRMFAELLEMRTADEPTQGEYLNTIVNESERLTRLLNNVLDFSRIEHGQKSYAIAPTQLDQVIRSAIRVMEYPLNAQGFHLRAQIDEAMPPVPADPDAVKQAVLNLLTNAVKYSGKSRAIELQLRRDGGEALIQVTDHGIGIPAHEQARIFEKFYRANVPENHAISGTGLGLALVAHIVHAHHGSVRVDSRPGDGTTFSMRLPMSTPASQRPAGPASLLTVADASTDGPTVPSAAEARS